VPFIVMMRESNHSLRVHNARMLRSNMEQHDM
jgi:hypothetical protein